MSGAHQSNSRSKTTNRKKGSHRVAPKPSRQPYNWLGVSAVTLGLGAAMASGTGIANAKGGNDSSSSTTSPSSSGTSGTSGTSSTATNSGNTASTPNTKGHKHAKTTKSGSDSSTANDATGPAAAAAVTDSASKPKKPKTATNSASKTKPTAATATTATPATTTATAVAKATAAAVPTTTTKAVALAAINPAATTGSTSTTNTTANTPHATSTNTIVAAIQTALINLFTTPSTIAQLVANGLTSPVSPTSPVTAFLWSMFRGMEQFAGLVPKVGTPTSTSDPATGTVTGALNVTVPAGGPALTYSMYTNPLFGSVTIDAAGTYTYKSNIVGSALSALGLNPTDKFTVTASDGVASTNVTVTVPVLAANNTPSTPTAGNISENLATGVVTGTLNSTSPDGSAVTFHVVTSTIGGQLNVDSATGAFTYTPTALYRQNASLGVITTDTFQVNASNGQFSSGNTTVTVTISPANNVTPTTPTVTNQQMNAVTGVARSFRSCRSRLPERLFSAW